MGFSEVSCPTGPYSQPLPCLLLTSSGSAHLHPHRQLDHVPQSQALLWDRGTRRTEWVAAPWGYPVQPYQALALTFLVLYRARQMEMAEMRKMQRAYQ